MTQTSSQLAKYSQTEFSTGAMVEIELPIPTAKNKTTEHHSGKSEALIRAQYIKPTIDAPAQIVISLNSYQVKLKTAIRNLNEELQGGYSESSTTCLNFITCP